MPTTSHPQRRSSGRNGSVSHTSPLKSIRLKVKVVGGRGKELARLAADKGLAVEEKGGSISIVISVATPEEAIAQLGLFSAILAARA